MGDDAQLEEIRQRRMQQLMSQYGGQGGGQGELSPEAEQQKAEAAAAQEEQRKAMLFSVLQPQARERLARITLVKPRKGISKEHLLNFVACICAVARIALVKPEKARGVEDIVLNAARRGQLGEKVSEQRLIELLEQINEQTSRKSKVTIQRRRAFDDDDY